MNIQNLTPKEIDKEELKANVSDSLYVRRKLVDKIRHGELTLEEAKQELLWKQHQGTDLGLKTRKEYWSI